MLFVFNLGFARFSFQICYCLHSANPDVTEYARPNPSISTNWLFASKLTFFASLSNNWTCFDDVFAHPQTTQFLQINVILKIPSKILIGRDVLTGAEKKQHDFNWSREKALAEDRFPFGTPCQENDQGQQREHFRIRFVEVFVGYSTRGPRSANSCRSWSFDGHGNGYDHDCCG